MDPTNAENEVRIEYVLDCYYTLAVIPLPLSYNL